MAHRNPDGGMSYGGSGHDMTAGLNRGQMSAKLQELKNIADRASAAVAAARSRGDSKSIISELEGKEIDAVMNVKVFQSQAFYYGGMGGGYRRTRRSSTRRRKSTRRHRR